MNQKSEHKCISNAHYEAARSILKHYVTHCIRPNSRESTEPRILLVSVATNHQVSKTLIDISPRRRYHLLGIADFLHSINKDLHCSELRGCGELQDRSGLCIPWSQPNFPNLKSQQKTNLPRLDVRRMSLEILAPHRLEACDEITPTLRIHLHSDGPRSIHKLLDIPVGHVT